jgi:NADH:ubiquinone oxidoreductase subunit 4 (subunit M)
VLGTSGVVLGAWYLLTMVQQAFFGPLREPHHGGEPIQDINFREFVAVVPICALCLWIGVMPQVVINTIKPDVDAVVAVYEEYLTNSERVADVRSQPTGHWSHPPATACAKITNMTLDQPRTFSEL